MDNTAEVREGRTSPWKIFLWVVGFSAIGLPALILIRTLFYQPFNIPAASSEPNYMVGDFIFVSKFAYGYSKYSFSPFNFFSFEGRTGNSLPAAGDVVVFKYPADTSVDYIKRVVGLPGDRIKMIAGVLNINGVAVKLEPVELAPEYYNMDGLKFFRETLPSGRSYVVSDLGDNWQDNTEEYVVPPKHYFMMGDSRDNSQDSRFLDKVGYVPEENIIGLVSILAFNSRGISTFNRPEESSPKP
jgi:signal peptidase I